MSNFIDSYPSKEKPIETYYYLEIKGKENIDQFYQILRNRNYILYEKNGYYPTENNPINSLTKSIIVSICINDLNKKTRIRYELGSALVQYKNLMKRGKEITFEEYIMM